MITVAAKTALVYLLLIIIMRILGKRQLGELEISELITTILISEIAAAPLTSSEAELGAAAVSLGVIVILEIVLSRLCCKHPRLRRILSSPPSTLIDNGVINQRELEKNRISPEELLSELRQQGAVSPGSVKYAILEENGLLSVVGEAQGRQANAGIIHIIISNGCWNEHGLTSCGRRREFFEKILSRDRLSASEIFLLTVDDGGGLEITPKNWRNAPLRR